MSEETPLSFDFSGHHPMGPTMVEKHIGTTQLVFMIYFLVCGGAYGSEELGSTLPPLYSLLGVVLLPWLFAMPVSFVVAELATSMPVQEGFVFWVQKAWGDFLSWMEGWNIVFIIMVDQAIYPVLFVSYLETLIELESWQRFLIILAFVIVSFIITSFAPFIIGNATILFAMFVIIPITLYSIMVFASGNVDVSNWILTEGNYDFGLYSSVLFWLYSGFDYSGFLAEETTNPAKVYPRALLISIVLITFTYLVPLLASFSITVDPEFFFDGSFSKISNELLPWGNWLSITMVVGALLSNLGIYIVYLHTASNALCSISEKGDAPKFLSYKIPRFNSPWCSILFYSITTLAWSSFDFTLIVEVESILYCAHILVLFATLIRLRYTHPDIDRPFKIKGPLPLIIVLFLIPSACAVFNIALTNWFEQVFALTLLASAMVGFFLKKVWIQWQTMRQIR